MLLGRHQSRLRAPIDTNRGARHGKRRMRSAADMKRQNEQRRAEPLDKTCHLRTCLRKGGYGRRLPFGCEHRFKLAETSAECDRPAAHGSVSERMQEDLRRGVCTVSERHCDHRIVSAGLDTQRLRKSCATPAKHPECFAMCRSKTQ